jgi:hypothetical protein
MQAAYSSWYSKAALRKVELKQHNTITLSVEHQDSTERVLVHMRITSTAKKYYSRSRKAEHQEKW